MILPEKDRVHTCTLQLCEIDFQRYLHVDGVQSCTPEIIKIPRGKIADLPETLQGEKRSVLKESFKTSGKFVYIALK